MELLKLDDRPAEYVWKDVTFFFRTKVTVGDKYAVDTAGSVLDGDKISYKPWELYTTLVRLFVTGWAGVTENGKVIAYSFDALMNRMPADLTEDLIMKLGLQIATTNGFLAGDAQKKAADLKND